MNNQQSRFPSVLFYVFAGMTQDSDYEERSHFDEHAGKICRARLKKVYAPGEWDGMDEYIGEYDDPLVSDVHVSMDMINSNELCDPYGFEIYIYSDKNQAIAKSRELMQDAPMGRGYGIDVVNESKKKNIIRLNESQLRNLIKESVKRVLREGPDGKSLDWQTYANAARKWADHLMQHPDDPRRKSNIIGHQNSKGNHDIHTDNRLRAFQDAMRKAFNKKYGYHSIDSPEVDQQGLGVRNDGYYEMPFETDNIGFKGYYDHLASETGTHRTNDHTQHRMEDQFDMPDIETGDHSSEPHRAYNLNGAWDKQRRYDRKPVEPEYDNYPYMKARNRGNQAIMDYQSGKSHYVKGKGWQND